MATSGSRSYGVTSWDTLKFSWAEKSQSVANNTTTITWKLELIATSDGAIYSTDPKTWAVTVNGTRYSGTNSVGISNNSTKTLASGTTTIPHNSDGTKTFNFSVSQQFAITFNEYINVVEFSGSGTLDTIARKSTFTASNGTLGTAQTIGVTQQSSSFTHTITYKCGSASGTIATKSSSTSISWTPPLSLASQNTTGTSVSVELTLTTYNGSTSLGSNSKTITCAIPASVKPSCSLTLEDVSGWDKTYGSPVQGLSNIKITVNTTLAYGSAIVSNMITAEGNSYAAASATTGVLKNAGDSPVTATVKDKRGRTGSASYTMKVQAYSPPNISMLTVHRSNADGTENAQGDYIRVAFSAAVTSLGGKNTANYALRYKKTTETRWLEGLIVKLDNVYEVDSYEKIFSADGSSSYDVEVEVKDRHHTTTRSTSASTAFTLINWGADGTSMGIGKVAEKTNALEVGLDNYFYGTTNQVGNRYTASSPGEANVSGFVLMARISVTAANADSPMTFVFTQRRALAPMTVHITLTNPTAETSAINKIVYEGANFDAYLTEVDGLTWDLYVKKASEWDTITLQDWWMSKTMESRVSVTFPGTLVDTVPTPYWKATPAQLQSLRDYIYPVGSVYISYSHYDPADMFGGTWVRITNAFLWAVDKDGAIGLTGGAKTHTLTVNELPIHSHGGTYTNAGTSRTHAWLASNGSAMGYDTVSAGGGAAHNNMPPYIQVSVWRRTA